MRTCSLIIFLLVCSCQKGYCSTTDEPPTELPDSSDDDTTSSDTDYDPTEQPTTEEPTTTEQPKTSATESTNRTTTTTASPITGEPGPSAVLSSFSITLCIQKINNVTATYTDALSNETSAEHEALEDDVCDWLQEVVAYNGMQITDCRINNVTSGNIIVNAEVIVGSESEVSAEEVRKAIISYNKYSGILTVDTDKVRVVKEELLKCCQCSFFEFIPLSESEEYYPFSEGDQGCLSGTGISSFACHRFPSTGRTHRCVTYEHVEGFINNGIGKVRVFGRGCLSVSSGTGRSYYGPSAVTFINENIDTYSEDYDYEDEEDNEDDSTDAIGDVFLRLYICDEDNCKTDFKPCADPRQIQCYEGTKCIYLSQFCDQRDDCPGGEDEDEGICGVPPPCSGPLQFKCSNETDDCIAKGKVCDGIVDCDNGIDESTDYCAATCNRTSAPDNGKIIDSIPKYQNGSFVKYACNDGYTLINKEQECISGGWKGERPQCIDNCRKPKLNKNFAVGFNGTSDNGGRYPHNGEITLQCEAGYYLDPDDDDNVFTCNRGKWNKTGNNKPSGFICKNINECEKKEDACSGDEHAICTDSIGSYKCTCMEGFEYGDNSIKCTDIDECIAYFPCVTNADCTNTEGSYLCECMEGYEGDGLTECNKILFFPYGEADYNLRYNYDYYARYYRNEFLSYYVWPPSGFAFGKNFFKYLYITADGLIVFHEYYSWWKSSFPYPLGSEFSSYDPTVVTPFWGKVDGRWMELGGNVYYKYYYSFWCDWGWWWWYDNCEEVFSEINSRIQSADEAYSDFEATWALVVTWDKMPEVTSAYKTENTNTFQAVLATDGIRSFALFIYQNGGMKWDAVEKKNAVIGYNNQRSSQATRNIHSEMGDKYRPDKEMGNMGKGYWLVRLDENEVDAVNPDKYCEEWANDQPSWTADLGNWVRPCPCTVAQAQGDSRYITCERISLSLDQFNEPGEEEVWCYQQRWPTWVPSAGLYWRWWWWWWYSYPRTWYTTGARCSYNSEGALITGYDDVWSNSNAQLYHGALGGFYYWSPYASKVDWRDKEVLARYYCCKKSDKCDLYERHRPPLTCAWYIQVQPGCFYGDPHIVTHDGGTYSFNGCGEYTMVMVEEMDYELQGRTGFAMVNGTVQESGGTVFIAFAARLGITTVEFILNENRTEFVTVVNGTDVVNATMLKEGDSYLDEADSSVTIDNTAPTNSSGGRIAARWSTTLPGDNQTDVDFTVIAGVKLGMLDIVVEVPPELKDLNITSGLMGVYSGSDTDDFVFPNGSMLEPAGENLTEREIFDYGETWRTTADTSLFSHSQEGGDWDTYNDKDYVPKFLDELLVIYDGTEFLAQAYEVCGMENTECLFDALATNSTEIGANTAKTDEMFQELVSNLNNFPPNVSDITETSNTDSLQDNRVLCLIVNTSYSFQIDAADPNGDDVMYSLPYEGLGATISDSGELSLKPTSTEQVKLAVLVSDGKANTSVSFKLKLCSCENDGECDWNSTSHDAAFSVVSCICTPGWAGSNCSVDLDSCEENPCYPGVQCIDLPPPEVNATCGSCPPGLDGNGFTCFDFNECADEIANDCNQTCDNTLGSYECSCNEGYQLYIDNKACIDIDECLEFDTNECDDNATCSNTIGSYECPCNNGYEEVDGVCLVSYVHMSDTNECDGNATCSNTVGSYECPCNDGYEKVDGVCLDTDECLTYPCANIAECINSPGSYVCQCKSGYYGDGVTCTDIDECLGADTNNCDEMASCKNEEGSFECTCNAGWEGNGVGCSDVNECNAGTAECHSRADCTNTEGSYKCSCQDGFIGDGLSCTDIDECEKQIDDCEQVCANTAPGYDCDCYDGFQLSNDNAACNVQTGRDCDDEDKTCGAYGQCVLNSDNADECVCERGAELSDDGTACDDIDECADDTNDCDAEHGTCSNEGPGYICSCDTGYEIDNDQRTCKDIDECSSTNDCHTEASCENTDGSHTCSCNIGYTGDGIDCTNIDECDTNPCADNAACSDTPGSYQCACKAGYQGDGYNTCVDINECNADGICDAQATCDNTEGSFTCTCNEGYVGNGADCDDIDECTSFKSRHDCPENSRCINNKGSYRCSCESGYELPTLVVNDQFTCLDVDECKEGFDNCHVNAACTNTDGSFTCECNTGFEGNGVTCTDINECTSSIPCTRSHEKCKNRVGEYRCICQTNYYKQGSSSTCKASSSHSLVAVFSLVKGLKPGVLFDYVNTETNRDALAEDVSTHSIVIQRLQVQFLGGISIQLGEGS
ncbi:uncharacterized protein [Amphiura filiformis]|uniref:uncharacterized protein n=1 Tax=Amphiura filiformis TaxID=82378 RepID=UPI003B21EB82